MMGAASAGDVCKKVPNAITIILDMIAPETGVMVSYGRGLPSLSIVLI
jgi:hypothetical protein